MIVPNDWWKGFFSGVVLDFWRLVTSQEQTRSEADFIQEVLRVPPGGRLLDVPCGGGRLSIELASRRYLLTGIDLSAGFIAEARAAAAERQLPTTFEQRDMQEPYAQAVFDGAFCFGNSFGYFDDEGNEAYLKAVAGALKPGGRFVMETTTMEAILTSFQERSWFQAGDILFLEENDYSLVRGRVETEYTFVRDGKVERRKGWQRLYTYRELCALLQRTGFARVEGYGSRDRSPYGLKARQLLLVAEKSA